VAKSKKKKKGKKKKGVNVEQAVGMGLEDMLQKVRLETLQAIVARVEQDDISYEGAVREAIQDIEAGIEPIVVENVWGRPPMPEVSEINATKAGENVWVPKVEGDQSQAYLGVRDLADVIGVHKESVYKFLRKNFPDSRPAPGHTWFLTIEMRDAVLENWNRV